MGTIPDDLDTTVLDYALKVTYDKAKMVQTMMMDNVAYARVPKNEKFPGKSFNYALQGTLPPSSVAFSVALSNRAPATGIQLALTKVNEYVVGRIDNDALVDSASDEGALMEAMTSQVDPALEKFKRVVGIKMYGNGSGKIGSIASPGADPTVTLENSDDITNFEVNQSLVLAADEASAVRSGYLYVASIDRDAGTFENMDSAGSAANVTTAIAAATDGDAIFNYGDYASASARSCLMGFGGWIPATASGTVITSFFGANRSADVTRYAGVRYNDTTYPGISTMEAIMLVVSRIKRNGWTADTCYMGVDRMRGLINSLHGNVQYVRDTVKVMDDGEVIAEVGFDGIVVACMGSHVKCFADLNCPEKQIHVQKLDTWELKSAGPYPRWLAKSRIVENADQVEFRLGGRGNLRCLNPAANGRFDYA